MYANISKNTKGNLIFTKSYVQSLSNICNDSPNSLQVFLILCSYIDDNNSIITNNNTIANILKIEPRKVQYCLHYLEKHNFITINKVSVFHQYDIFGKIHDKALYYKSKKTIWKSIGNKYIKTITIKGIYKKITINKNLVYCKNNYFNSIILHIKNNLFYDAQLKDSAITIIER